MSCTLACHARFLVISRFGSLAWLFEGAVLLRKGLGHLIKNWKGPRIGWLNPQLGLSRVGFQSQKCFAWH